MQIHEYARQGDVAGVRRELDSGAPVDVRDPETDHTPLADAASSPVGTLELLELLLERGADPNAVCGEDGESILILGVKTWDVGRLALLLDAGADVAFRSKRGSYDALLSCFFQKGAHRDRRLLETVELLLRRGAPLGRTSTHGESPLGVASRLGRVDVVGALLHAGDDPAPLRWSELHRAVALRTPAEVQRLVSGGAALEARDVWERTAWLVSIELGDLETVKLLAAAGAQRDVRDRASKDALMTAIEACHFHVLEWLIAEGLAVDEPDDSGTTALMAAASVGEPLMVDALLRAGANPMAVDKYGDTVLHKAATVDVLRKLLAAGADFADVGEDLRRALTGLGRRPLLSTLADFGAGRVRRFGTQNPERVETPFLRAMVAARAHAWTARRLFAPDEKPTAPVWCYGRYGQSITELGDGRVIEVGGEHEDWYDPDFCIYNDVVVYDGRGDFAIYAYPRDVFPPTDFHTATLVEGWIYLIGSVGYPEERQRGRAQVFRLSTTDFHMERVETVGDDPGWISRQRARLRPDGLIHVSAGKVGAEKDYPDNKQEYLFDSRSHAWKAQG
jgi:ankyrin repeat protein